MSLQVPCHFILELLIFLIGLCIVLTHIRMNIYGSSLVYLIGSFTADAALIFSVGIYFCSQVNVEPFYALLKSYRSIIIILSTLAIISCDIAFQILNDSVETIDWIRTIFNDISYTNAVIVVLFIDCVPNITNISRILFPTVLILVTAFNFYLSYHIYPDKRIFKYQNGSISIEEIQRAAMLSMILYCINCVWRVFKDTSHEKFSILSNPIPRKSVLKSNLKAKDRFSSKNIEFCCFDIPFWIYYGLLFLCIAIVLILSVIPYRNEWIFGCCLIGQLYLIPNLLYQHFDFNIIKRWFHQFRCWLLMLAVLINICAVVTKLIWNVFEFEDVRGIIIITFNTITFNCAILLCLCRDGMKQAFPLSFTVGLCILLLFVSTWYAVFIEFDIENIDDQIPSWFTELEKECYYQINFVMLLILVSTYWDTNHAYFVLIIENRQRTDFFTRAKAYTIPSALLSKGLWHKNQTSDLSSNLLRPKSEYYGSTMRSYTSSDNTFGNRTGSTISRRQLSNRLITLTPAPSEFNTTTSTVSSAPTDNSNILLLLPHNKRQRLSSEIELSSTNTTGRKPSGALNVLMEDDENAYLSDIKPNSNNPATDNIKSNTCSNISIPSNADLSVHTSVRGDA